VFFPETIKFTDGSVWKPEREGECFNIFWRDEDHPQLEVLPTLQVEMVLD
jgi:hypothetical protein